MPLPSRTLLDVCLYRAYSNGSRHIVGIFPLALPLLKKKKTSLKIPNGLVRVCAFTQDSKGPDGPTLQVWLLGRLARQV